MKRCHNCNAVILSDREQSVLSYISRENKVTSEDVQRNFCISVTNANNTLRRLWEFGYLTREGCNIISGGSFFVYSIKQGEGHAL